MAHLAMISTRQEVEKQVIRLVSQQSALDEFEIKLCDDINDDLELAGTDVEELFAAVSREFGTNFDELGTYFEYFFYPEVSPMPPGFMIAVGIVIVGASILWNLIRSNLWRSIVALGAVASIYVCNKLIQNYKRRNYESLFLRFTISDIVDSVMIGKWIPPEDIWDRVNRLGLRKASN